MVHDLLFSARLLRKRPGQTLVAVAALALGIGFTTAMFSILDGSFLRGLPLPDASRVMSVQRRGAQSEGVRPAELRAWRERQTSFDSLSAWMGVSMIFSGDRRPADLCQGAYVSAPFFEATGIQPILGRTFDAREDQAGASVVVISYDLWGSRYLKDPGVLGTGVRMGGEPVTIIGVMPKGFKFPLQQHYWSPLGAVLTPANEPHFQRVEVLGKLRNGVGRAAAEAELDSLAALVPAADPEDRERRTVVLPFIEGYTESARRPLWLMAMASACVLLIACANSTNLLLARGALRARELAVRAALGAARRSLFSAVLAEALLLSVLGGAAGLAVAQAGIDLYNRSGGLVQSYWVDIELDRVALLFAAGATLASAFLAGLVPALRASGIDPGEALKDQTQGVTSLRAGRLGRWLVALQVALSCALLVATGQIVESVRNLYLNDFGDRPAELWTARLFLDTTIMPEPADWLRFYDELRRRLESLPAVSGVALTSHLPASRTPRRPVEVDGAGPTSARPPQVRYSTVSPGFFSALGRPIFQGRDFSPSDTGESLPVVLVNRRFAELHFPGESPLGRRIQVGEPGAQSTWTIAGVVPDLYLSWDLDSERIGSGRAEGIYFPLAQNPTPGCSLAIRTEGRLADLQPQVRRILSGMAADLPLLDPGTLADRIAGTTASFRMVRGLFSVFGLAALVLAGIGLYAVSAVLAQQRRHEMAIRIAVGAQRRHAAGLIVRAAAVQVLAGAGLGWAWQRSRRVSWVPCFTGWNRGVPPSSSPRPRSSSWPGPPPALCRRYARPVWTRSRCSAGRPRFNQVHRPGGRTRTILPSGGRVQPTCRGACPLVRHLSLLVGCLIGSPGRRLFAGAADQRGDEMAIKVGDKVPNVKLQTVREGQFQSVWTEELFQGKKVVLFAVPGAFTSVCSDHHLPGFIELADHLKSRGADLVAGTAVNDIEVLSAWFKSKDAGEKIMPLADGNADFARAMGRELDSRPFGMGIRSQRYAAVIEDGVLKALNVDAPGEVAASSASAILQSL